MTSAESLWIDRLNRIGIIYFRPLVTVSFLNNKIDTKQRIRLFTAIERFIFIGFRMSRSMANYRNSEFYKTARLLRLNETTVDNVEERINYLINEVFSYIRENDDEIYFNYDYFKTFLDKKFKNGGGGFYSWNGLRYFLYEYEMAKVKQRGSQKIDWKLFIKGEKDKVSIEHIYPQTPDKKCWKDSFKGYKKAEISFLQGSLGNLLPLSQSVNSSLQNDCFVDKKNPRYNERKEKIRQGYSDGSHSEIEVATYEKWNPDNILERGLNLIEFMEKRWKLKFENEYAKTELLFLDFMLPDEDETESTKTEV